MVQLSIGDLFEITCAAVGVPVPVISWRRNWGNIPPKCRTTSIDGVGTISCPDIQPEDQGQYSCESINIKGTTFAIPDTILVVKTDNVCRPGYFNSDARSEAECIKCFCFGHGGECRSADLFIYHVSALFSWNKILFFGKTGFLAMCIAWIQERFYKEYSETNIFFGWTTVQKFLMPSSIQNIAEIHWIRFCLLNIQNCWPKCLLSLTTNNLAIFFYYSIYELLQILLFNKIKNDYYSKKNCNMLLRRLYGKFNLGINSF